MAENLEQVYQQYMNDIYRFLFSLCHHHHTAEDLVQETFFRAFLHLESYQSKNIKTWLFTVAYHTFIDHYRKHGRTIVKDEDFFSLLRDKKRAVEDKIIIQSELQETVDMLKELPEKHQHAVLLYDFHYLSYKEAATVMQTKESHFKVLLYRGRQAIRKRKAEEHE